MAQTHSRAISFNHMRAQPISTNSYVPVMYFVVGVFTFNFFLKNLFIALVFETYMHIRSISSSGQWLSQKARRWESYKLELLYKVGLVNTYRRMETIRHY